MKTIHVLNVWKKRFVFLLCIGVSSVLYAEQYLFTPLGIEQGLSSNYVVSITQDKDGFLWFATEEGLNKFDGTRFINFYKHTGSLSANALNCIYADPVEPVIWIATQRAGLNAYNYELNTLEVFTHDDKLPGSIITNDVTSISPAADGNLWISTYYGGIDYFDKVTKEFTHYNMSTVSGLVANNTWTVKDDGNGALYIGHVTQGLTVISLNDKQIRNYQHDPSDPESIPGNEVHCIYKDNSRNIWVGTNKGLALFDTETEKFVRMDGDKSSKVLSSYIYSICQMSDNKLWVATELNGVAVIDLKQRFLRKAAPLSIKYYTIGYNKYNLSSATVRSLFQDSFQNIWLGTHGGGIDFVSHMAPIFNTYDYSPISEDKNSMTSRFVLSLCLDRNERLWIGTEGGGVNVFEKGERVAVYGKSNGILSSDVIQALFKDTDDNIWLGAYQGGVTYYDSNKKKFRQIELNGSSEQNVRCFFEDSDKYIWIGTHLGIFVLDPVTQNEIHYYHTGNEDLPENLIHAIAQDNRKRMWIGTFGQGLAVYTQDMQLVDDFKVSKGFCSNSVNYIFKDSRGQMWVATGEGLVCFPDLDSLNYKVYTREDGLLNTYISAIAEDKAGNIWFSTNAGISCYLMEQNRFLNYNYFDKIPMGNFSSSVCQDKIGTLYFGANGVRYFNSASVLTKRKVPPVVITEMKFYEADVNYKGEKNLKFFNEDTNNVELSYKQNTFNVTFNIQNFSLVNQVEYAYRLKGLDNSWYTVEENNVMFRNIPPGHYEFQVKARVKNHEWHADSQLLHIYVAPPFWRSWWAKLLYFVCAGLILLGVLYAYKKRVDLKSLYEMERKSHEQELVLNNERLRFYTNITHELRTPLTLILGPLEDLLKDSRLLPKQLKKISVVRQSALRLLNLINQILEFRKTETQNKQLCVDKGNIVDFVKAIGIKYKELNSNPNIHFEIYVEKEEILLFFDKEVVNTILDNLISNAIKYTSEGKISISLNTVSRGELAYTEIRVSDTGLGIPKEEQEHIFDRYYQVLNGRQNSGTGIGLALVKNLVNLHEGEIRVESDFGKGSSFVFSLLTHNIYTNALHCEQKEEKNTESGNEVKNADEQSASGKPLLLVVEDDEDIREYISDSFDDSFDVITASDGEKGCDAAFTHIPDIIVSDVMMPGMDGIHFCKKMKEDIRTSHIPVILLTAKDSIQDKEEGYLSGADSYLTKPFSATLLHSRINNLLEIRRKLADHLSANLNVDVKGSLLKNSLNQLDNEFIEKLTSLIEENLESEKVDITYLSDRLFMSSSTLYRKVKALTGISTNEFIRKIKMKNAEQLLLTGKYSFSEIAFKVGVSNPKYFRECFKEEFGVPPSDYIKRMLHSFKDEV